MRSAVTESTRVLVLASVWSLTAACAGDAGSSPAQPGDYVVRFIVTNDLAAPITIAVDGTVSAILSSGSSTGLTVSPTAQWLTWTSAKPTDSAGTPIPDDIGQVQVRVSGISTALQITNLINDTTYVTAQIFNETSARVSIGVYDGSRLSCASVLRAMSGTVSGFTKLGYYRLLPATEIRAYRDPDNCTGPYVTWRAPALAAFSPGSGLVNLVLSAPP